jgi:predicted phage tail protein
VLTYTSTGLTNGQTYYYKVSAVNSVGEGSQSNEASATPRTVPTSPSGLTAVPGNAQVTLTWTAPSSNGGSAITNYGIYRGTVSGGESLVTTIGNVLTYTNTGLTNGQIYYYKVSAINAAGEGGMSNEASTTPITVPSAPTLVSATPSSRSSWPGRRRAAMADPHQLQRLS